MQRGRQGEQGIKCSLVYVDISVCSFFWHIIKWLRGEQNACMACLSCRMAELEARWQQWLFCAGGSQHEGIRACLVHRLLHHQVST